jgi:hypothetical protein
VSLQGSPKENEPEAQPLVSFVAAVRDPSYGGDLLRRVDIFLHGIIRLANRHRLACEVILVEWNNPPGSPPLHTLLAPRLPLGKVGLRVIAVPPEIHGRMPNAAQVPFFEPLAKNVALRRARGKFWLATNPDLLFSDPLFRYLASELSPKALYRLDRYDVGKDVPGDKTLGEQLAFCARNIVGWHSQYGSIPLPGPMSAGPRSRLAAIQRQVRAEYRRAQRDPGYRGPYYEHLGFPLDGIHTNAAGCFLLMHREIWKTIRGHPEFHTRGHADSITCWAALSAGAHQVVIEPPCLMFHQPHGRGSQSRWLQTEWHSWYERFLEAKRSGEPLVINGPDWGLPSDSLEEWILEPAPRGVEPAWRKVASAARDNGRTPIVVASSNPPSEQMASAVQSSKT